MDKNNYKATSDQPLQQNVSNALAEIGSNPVSEALRNIHSNAEDVLDTAAIGLKLTLSAEGVRRSIIRGGSYSDIGNSNEYKKKLGNFEHHQYSASSGIEKYGTGKDFSEDNQRKEYTASTIPYDRYDSSKDFYFRCGDYFMPLSIRFRLRAQKNLVESQLIDGPYIIERVSKSPKTIDVTIRLERKPSENPSPLHIVNNENLYNPVPDISAMVNDLYETRDVFVIENPILNSEHGITHVVLREYEIVPGEGTTLMTMNMSLTQIDMKANIISNEGNNTGNGEILPNAEILPDEG